MEGTQKPVLYVHMRIRLSGHEKNHKPTCEECVRHHPKKKFPAVPMGIRVYGYGSKKSQPNSGTGSFRSLLLGALGLTG
jgi:hypothetical protein